MSEKTNLVPVKVAGLTLDPAGLPIVLLKETEGDRIAPIWIGDLEARAILQAIEKISFPRPMTHDLMVNIIKEMGATLERIEITEIKENTFYAVIVAKNKEGEMRIDSRPSDAIALALRSDAKINMAEEVLEQAKVEVVDEKETLLDVDGEISKDKWAKILESLSPDAFGKYKQ